MTIRLLVSADASLVPGRSMIDIDTYMLCMHVRYKSTGPLPAAIGTVRPNRADDNQDQQAVGRQDNGSDLNLDQNDDGHSTSITGSSDRRANVPLGRPQAFIR